MSQFWRGHLRRSRPASTGEYEPAAYVRWCPGWILKCARIDYESKGTSGNSVQLDGAVGAELFQSERPDCKLLKLGCHAPAIDDDVPETRVGGEASAGRLRACDLVGRLCTSFAEIHQRLQHRNA